MAGCVGKKKEELETPALLVNMDFMEQNIDNMALMARESGVRLRPHAKAHKSVAIARRQVACGAVGVAVATLGEGEAMASGGIRDIMFTSPLVGAPKLEGLRQLAHKARVAVVIDSLEAAEAISCMAKGENIQIEVYAEVDTGLRRCGVEPGKPVADFVEALLKLPNLTFGGLNTAELQVYSKRNQDEVRAVELRVASLLNETVEALCARGIEVHNVCAGSTASANVIRCMDIVTEIHPGSYVFNSLDGVVTGATSLENCAMTVLATVISRPGPDRAVIDTGFKRLSLVTVHDHPGYGYVKLGGGDLVLERLYEEHGVLSLCDSSRALRIGDLVEVVPCSCSAVSALFDEMIGIRGDKVEVTWPIVGRQVSR